jgi:hypothetical protein
MWSYYEAATGCRPADFGMVETDADGHPRAVLIATRDERKIDFFGSPSILEFAPQSNAREGGQLGGEVARRLLEACESHQLELSVRLISERSVLEGFDHQVLAAGARTLAAYSSEVDLTLTEDAIWSSLRSRFRSYVNKGRRALELQTSNAESVNRELFTLYRGLHREVAGRITRPTQSWDEMQERLERGEAELQVAFLAERPVAATFVASLGEVAVYASGAYVRDLGNFPVSHWPMYSAILSAQRRGHSRFIVGAGYYDRETAASAKLQSIAQFKRGFATSVVHHRQYNFDSRTSTSVGGG